MGKMSKFGSEKLILSADGEPMFRRIIDDDGNKTIDVPVTEKGFTKNLTVKIIQKREYFSERTFENKVAYFIVTFRCKMPHDRALKFCYFYYEPKAMGNVCVRDFSNDYTTTINVLEPETCKYYNIQQVGKPKRITLNQAKLMVLNKEVLPMVFNEKGEIGETTSY